MATAKNPFVETFQQALIDAGYLTQVSGAWDRQTIDSMAEFAEDHGFPKGNYPTAEIMALLEIHPSGWWTIAKSAGAPKNLLDSISAVAKKQIALALIEGPHAVTTATSDTTRTSGASRTSAAGTTDPYSRVGDRSYAPVQETPAGYVQMPDGQIVAAADSALIPSTSAEKKFKMPTWGWVAIGVGGTAVVATIAGVVIWKAHQKPEPAMAGYGYQRRYRRAH
jgi:hypothetical protein